MSFQALAVGNPYPGWTVGHAHQYFEWNEKGCDLLVAVDGLHKDEISAFRNDPIKMSLSYVDGIAFVNFEVRGFLTLELPFSASIIPPERMPPLEEFASETARLATVAILIEARTGIVRGIRRFTVSPTYTQRLIAIVKEQAARPMAKGDHDRLVDRIFARHPNSGDIQRLAEIHEVAGRI